jgi:hypothetical protein
MDPDTGDSIREHQLCAIASGHDPGEVFANQVHHCVHIPADYGIQLDLPSAVVPVSRSDHRQIHQNEHASVPVETVLSDG